jgi:hemin uptake protein HemP
VEISNGYQISIKAEYRLGKNMILITVCIINLDEYGPAMSAAAPVNLNPAVQPPRRHGRKGVCADSPSYPEGAGEDLSHSLPCSVVASRRRGGDPSASSRVIEANPVPAISSTALLDGRDEVILVHDGQRYHLRRTRNGKLILTK